MWIERDYLVSWSKVLDGQGEDKESYALIQIGVSVWQFAVQELHFGLAPVRSGKSVVKLLYSFASCISLCSQVREAFAVVCKGRSLEDGGLGGGNSSSDEVMHESFRTDPFKVVQYGVMIV